MCNKAEVVEAGVLQQNREIVEIVVHALHENKHAITIKVDRNRPK